MMKPSFRSGQTASVWCSQRFPNWNQMTIRAGLAACLVIGLASCGSKEVPLLPEEISGHRTLILRMRHQHYSPLHTHLFNT